MKYVVVFERTKSNYSAYVPDLPGCIATGETREKVAEEIKAAIAFHLDGLRQEDLPVPEPTSWSESVEAS